MEELKKPWASSTLEVISSLQSSTSGLSDKEVEARLASYGGNTFQEREGARTIILFLKQFVSPLIFLLVAAAVLTGFLKEWLNMWVIAFAVVLNVVLGFYHEYHAESTLKKLSTYIKERARVIRGGREQEVDSALLVPGDLVKLSYGTRVPADCRILSVNNFLVDEAILTGESLPIIKSEEVISSGALVAERKNIAHAGTLVVQGYATGVVYATGNKTEIGKIAGIVSKIKRTDTPLQKGVKDLAWIIFGVVFAIIGGIFLLGLSRGEPILEMLILSAAVAVGAVPESLPIALTVILAIGAEHIAAKKGIVRKLAAAETLGSTTLIMTDKTGTLTLSDMELEGVHTLKALLEGREDRELSLEEKSILEMTLSNVDVTVENPTAGKEDWIFRGRPFEVSMVKASRNYGIPLDNIFSSTLVLPFNSTNKFSVAEKNDQYIVMGAPEILLRRSNISKEEYLKMEAWIESTSRAGKRLVGLATLPKEKKHFNAEDAVNLNFLGMFVFYDPIRPEVPEAIKNIESHGIKMVLVTGDLKGTALSVAKELDWKVTEEEVLTGGELGNMSDADLLAVIPKMKIFARVTPEDKLRIGKLYQQLGEIVAMTGDGVNDAPALKAMDIGVSLGSGSDVAKSAADLVLLDDNFKTISLAIDEGRRILANIRKTFTYLMSNSFDEVFVIGGSLVMGVAFPLTALQIIWVNLFTGSLPALAFAFDENIDKEKYLNKESKLIFTREVKALIFGIGILSSALLFVLYYVLIKVMGLEISLARSIFFVCFSSYILAIAFSFRSLNRPIFSYQAFSNKELNASILIGVLILVITMVVPFMRNIFEISPLPLSWIPFIFGWLAFNIFLVEAGKYLVFKLKSI